MTYSIDKLDIHDALLALNGHLILGVDMAKRVCASLGVEFSETLVITWKSAEEAEYFYSFYPTNSGPGSGVDGLKLSYYVCEKLDITDPPGQKYIGSLAQSRANAAAVEEKMKELGRL